MSCEFEQNTAYTFGDERTVEYNVFRSGSSERMHNSNSVGSFEKELVMIDLGGDLMIEQRLKRAV
jgi:hypothetical protein